MVTKWVHGSNRFYPRLWWRNEWEWQKNGKWQLMNYAAVGAEPGWDTVEWLYACTGPQFALLDDDDNLADGMRVRFVMSSSYGENVYMAQDGIVLSIICDDAGVADSLLVQVWPSPGERAAAHGEGHPCDWFGISNWALYVAVVPLAAVFSARTEIAATIDDFVKLSLYMGIPGYPAPLLQICNRGDANEREMFPVLTLSADGGAAGSLLYDFTVKISQKSSLWNTSMIFVQNRSNQ